MQKKMIMGGLFGAMVALTAGASQAWAETRVVLKSATSSSSYYVMMVQVAEALQKASDGKIRATVEESQGSVQNLKEAAKRPGNFVFTTPPNLLQDALAGNKPFEGESGYDQVRALFVVPPITVHFVVREDSGIDDITQLAGKTFIAGGKGTFCEGRTSKIFSILDIADKVKTVDSELAAASNALRNRRIDGYATCSSHPTPAVQELATSMSLKILPFTPEQLAKVVAEDPASGPVTIDPGTYRGMDEPIQTVGMPVGAFGTTRMDDDTAYAITKAFWEQRDQMAQSSPWWNAVKPELVASLRAEIHPGAARYYREIGVDLPAAN
ncbi:TAXI family TRAP transporter solute-binding subunit [Telmatospirillum sp. J64-1]|uniref:TAXI family TRAP transporter solute-binding subunit n=1 Tax=Telmatospirillum sp. J64-1 TaxID=2502183 RepID=UPI002105A1FB|nr:TAXI family TRAP transporter solute-binding subunit [Telmatospirillum sp. J64-1]